MPEIENDERQTTVYKTQQRKLKTEQQEPHKKSWVIAGAFDG